MNVTELYLNHLNNDESIEKEELSEGFIDDYLDNKYKEIEQHGVGVAGISLFGTYLSHIHKQNKEKCNNALVGDTDLERKISYYKCLASSASKVISEINRQMGMTSKISDGEKRAETRKDILSYYKKWLGKYIKYQKKYQELLQHKYDLEKHAKDLLEAFSVGFGMFGPSASISFDKKSAMIEISRVGVGVAGFFYFDAYLNSIFKYHSKYCLKDLEFFNKETKKQRAMCHHNAALKVLSEIKRQKQLASRLEYNTHKIETKEKLNNHEAKWKEKLAEYKHEVDAADFDKIIKQSRKFIKK